MSRSKKQIRRREITRSKIAALEVSVEEIDDLLQWHADEVREWKKVRADQRRKLSDLRDSL